MYMNGTLRNTCTIHAGYMHDTWDTYRIGKNTKTYRKPHVTLRFRGARTIRTVMMTTIMTRRMTMRMTVRNVRTHTQRLSLTDGPRKCEQASITFTMTTAPNAPRTFRGVGHYWAHPLQQRTVCPCRWYFFLWGAWEAGHVNYRPGADRCSVAGTGVGHGGVGPDP